LKESLSRLPSKLSQAQALIAQMKTQLLITPALAFLDPLEVSVQLFIAYLKLSSPRFLGDQLLSNKFV